MTRLVVGFVGGTGRLGSVLVQALIDADNYEIRLVLRPGIDYQSPNSQIMVVRADRTSEPALTSALRGCDVVVNVLGDRAPVEGHFTVLRAVLVAGIKRYIPSQWGNTPNTEALGAVPFLQSKLGVNKEVEKAAQQGSVTFTTIAGGPWFEYLFEHPGMMSMPERVFLMHESPDVVFGVSSRETFAAALVGVLDNLEDTKNKHLNVNLALLSQKQALKLAQEALPGEVIKTIPRSYDERYKTGLEKVLSGVTDTHTFSDVLSKVIFDPKVNVQPGYLDNDMLGVKLATDEEIRELLRQASTSERYKPKAAAS
ncbi:NAD(P)-binding protein [Sarocladium strictum]